MKRKTLNRVLLLLLVLGVFSSQKDSLGAGDIGVFSGGRGDFGKYASKGPYISYGMSFGSIKENFGAGLYLSGNSNLNKSNHLYTLGVYGIYDFGSSVIRPRFRASAGWSYSEPKGLEGLTSDIMAGFSVRLGEQSKPEGYLFLLSGGGVYYGETLGAFYTLVFGISGPAFL